MCPLPRWGHGLSEGRRDLPGWKCVDLSPGGAAALSSKHPAEASAWGDLEPVARPVLTFMDSALCPHHPPARWEAVCGLAGPAAVPGSRAPGTSLCRAVLREQLRHLKANLCK